MNLFEQLILFDCLRLIPVFLIFGYAAYKDYRHGEVTNRVWLYAPLGASFVLAEYLLFAPDILPLTLISMVAPSLIALGLFALNKGFGGADSKALITLSLCYPMAPAYLAFIPGYALIIFCFASLISIIMMAIKRQRTIRYLPYVLFSLTFFVFLPI
jgi:hypothetical protein